MPGHYSGSTRRARLPRDWHTLRRRVITRDRGRCVQCGAPGTDVDHITHGDDHRLANLQLLCHPCHNTKTQAEAQAARQAKSTRRPPQPHPGLH